jgi:serine/threonine protein phosphatase PrpC
VSAPEAGPEAVLACPSCGEPTGPGDAFCEACGTELAPAVVSIGTPGFVPSCPVCSVDPSVRQSAGVTPDGYCESCGRKVPTGRDHTELDLGLLAGVTDRGRRHPRNEDAMALATAESAAGPIAIAVVCDGVSSSPRPDEASLAGAQAGVRVLLEAVRRGEDPREASLAAVRSAATEMAGLAGPGGAPSATYVSVVAGVTAAATPDPGGGAESTADSALGSAAGSDDVTDDAITLDSITLDSITPELAGGGEPRAPAATVTVCWLGDSRAYWLTADGGAQRLTTDDSLAQEMVASGLMDEADAMASPQAHVITRWLGADITEPRPHVAKFEPSGSGVVLVCTDGLWNYLPEAADLAERALPAATTDPLGAASELVKFALDAGGMDNITVVLVPFPLRSSVT